MGAVSPFGPRGGAAIDDGGERVGVAGRGGVVEESGEEKGGGDEG